MNLSRTSGFLPFASLLPWLNEHRISSLVQKDQYDRLEVCRTYSRSCFERGFASIAGIPAELSGFWVPKEVLHLHHFKPLGLYVLFFLFFCHFFFFWPFRRFRACAEKSSSRVKPSLCSYIATFDVSVLVCAPSARTDFA